jgi:ABC-type dipeptide/oligopeptide/nickel transport system permease subunit
MTPLTTWRRLCRLPGFVVGAAVLALVFVCALMPGWVVAPAPGSHDPASCSVRAPDGTYQDRLGPSSAHWFGTDAQGCEVFARVIHGARSSLAIGLGASVVMGVVGTGLGLAAAYRGGWVDAVVRRAADITLSLPFVVGAIMLLSVLAGEHRSAVEVALVLATLGWPATARVARTAARQVMVQPYVEAARAAGGGALAIVRRHVLPNTLPSVVPFGALSAGAFIGAEATLSYLGVGLQVPAVSWGLMIEQAQRGYETSPHLLVFPSLFLTATVMAFVLVGDAIRDALDPHLLDEPGRRPPRPAGQATRRITARP